MVRAEESNRPVVRISGIVIAAAFAVLPVAVPINAEGDGGDGTFVNYASLKMQNGAFTFYNGVFNGVQPPDDGEIVHASDIASPTQEWDITRLLPWGDDVPSSRGVYVLARMQDSDIQYGNEFLVGGTPIRGVNYDIVHAAASVDATSTDHISFSLPAFGDPAAPSGRYELFYTEEPEGKDYSYDETTDTYSFTPYTDDDLAQFLAQPDSPDSYGPDDQSMPLEINYIADGPKKCTEQCYSNVAFIPGIEGSRLYEEDGGNEDRLWEPGPDTDVEDLRMDENGESIKDGIYTKDIIDLGYGIPDVGDIYKTFKSDMDNLVANHTITAWEPLSYDWRQDLETTVTQPIALSGGDSYTMVGAIEQLASTSPTGKVTIIAHSMGGLVGKLLISELEKKGEADLIDKFVMVGTPEVGTPLAVAAMLHGEEQGMPFAQLPVFFRKDQARDFGLTTPSAYMLLPFSAYFSLTSIPVVSFELGSKTDSFATSYGSTITSSDVLQRFLLGADGRTQPAVSDTQDPYILSPLLLERAEAEQQTLAAWTPPSNIAVTQIAGWGRDTVSGLKYVTQTKEECGDISGHIQCGGNDILDYQPVFTFDGDNTVVAKSATYMNTPTYYVDLDAYNRSSGILNHFLNAGHSKLMTVPSVDAELADIITGATSTVPEYLSLAQPVPTGKYLRIQIHSPLDISITDANGNHLGIASTTGAIDEQIPDSYYLTFGEGKYLGLPADGTYHVAVQGSGEGTFTMQIDDVEGGVVATSTIYEDVPVSPELAGSFTLMDGSSSPLSLDTDGDGKTDVQLDNEGALSFEEYADLFDDAVAGSSMSKATQRILLNQMKSIERSQEQTEKQEQKAAKVKKNPIGNLIGQILGNALGRLSDSITEAELVALEKQVTQLTERKQISTDDGTKLLQVLDQMKELI